jgi:hypothetical protein
MGSEPRDIADKLVFNPLVQKIRQVGEVTLYSMEKRKSQCQSHCCWSKFCFAVGFRLR